MPDDDRTVPAAMGAPDEDAHGAPSTEARSPTLTRMLALWRAAARCEPASDDASATLVPAAAPARVDDADDVDADAAPTRRWRAR